MTTQQRERLRAWHGFQAGLRRDLQELTAWALVGIMLAAEVMK